MYRVIMAFVMATALEIAVAPYISCSPALRPYWYSGAMSGIVVFMCLGGIESARWLLRCSPASRTSGPKSDWTRLWLWLGPTGGVATLLGLLVCWALSSYCLPKTNLLLLGHFVMGPALWLGLSVFSLKDLFQEGLWRGLNGKLLAAGFGLHLLALAVFLWGYPALLGVSWKSEIAMLVGLVSYYSFAFYYVLVAGMLWIPLFNLWEPKKDKRA